MKIEKTSCLPRPEHPNPQWERANWKNLNGEWMFEIDYSASGEERGLQNQATLSDKILLPFCPESTLSGIGNTDFLNCVWYKRSITLSKEALAGNRVIFHIGAADFETHLWVNGAKVGLPHVGGYASFEYDITKEVKEGENLITIACYDDSRSPKQPSGKQSPKYKSHACFYTRTTGIWQTVWYELVPTDYIKYAKLIPDLENCSVSVQTELCGEGDLSAEVYYGGKKVGEAHKKNLSVTGQMEIALSEKHIWELGNGRLYDVILRFGKDEVKTYFGLRSVALKDGKFLLNGKSVFQRLVLDQGYYPDGIITAPTEEALIKDIQCGLDAGFNGARLHQKVFEPRYLYHCDRLGYMVWGEYGSWGMDFSDVANLSTFLPDWTSAVRRDYNHPAIIGWCPLNETYDYGPQQKRQDDSLVRIVYEQTKMADPTRPCIDTSGFFHVVTDIYDIHDYGQDTVSWKANFDKLFLENHLHDFLGRGRQHWKGEPVFISEYGGTGFCLPKRDGVTHTAWSYGESMKTYEEFYKKYKGLTDAILDNPMIIGYCYTQLTDVEQEQNGLFTYEERNPKFDMSIISAINRRKAAIED